MKTIKLSNTNKKLIYYILGICILLLVILMPQRNTQFAQVPKIDKNFNVHRVFLKSQKQIAKNFFHTLNIPYIGIPKKITFGNDEIGYFTTKNFRIDNEKITIEILPPTYKQEIHFIVHNKTIYSKKFNFPSTDLFSKVRIQKKGQFNAPFYLLTGVLHIGRNNDFNRAVFPLIINKLGEIIWAHIPDKGNRNFKKYLTSTIYDSKFIANLYSEQSSYFEYIDLKGNVLNAYSGKLQPSPTVVHHDFHYNDNQLITFSNYIAHARQYHKDLSFFENLKNIIKEPFSFVSSSIVNIDLRDKNLTTLTNGIDHFPLHEGAYMKRIMGHLKTNKPKVWAKWQKRVEFDHLHANSLQKVNNGWLVSYRNSSKLVFFNNDFTKVQWSLGAYSDNTYTPLDYRHAFFHQHHATMLSNGDILLIDNHPSPPAPTKIGTRILQIRIIGNKFKVVWNYQPNYQFHSRTRGSAFPLKNSNILGYYPESINGGDHLLEIDYQSGQPKGYMNISYHEVKNKISKKQGLFFSRKNLMIPDILRVGGGNRALPLYDLNDSYWVNE